jgi:hypothetical protein
VLASISRLNWKDAFLAATPADDAEI